MGALTEGADSASELEEGDASAPIEVLFVMPRLSFLRFFQSALDLMLERGIELRLLLESSRTDDPSEEQWLAAARRRPNFACEIGNHFRSDPLRDRRIGLRVGMEYVRRMGPAYENRVAGRPRARLARAPAPIRKLVRLPLVRTPRGLQSLYRVLAAIDRSLPNPAAAAAYVERIAPDVVAVCDKGHPGSLSSAYVKVGRELGIPTALCVASWDNLTNRQRTRVVPHALLVWNERQRQEAIDFHGLTAQDVAVTGAPRFDDWFSWRERDRHEFLARVGLDPTRPVVLWIGGALNHADVTEAAYVSTWIGALRSSGDPILRKAGILIRPHPERIAEWAEADYSEFSNVAVWPRKGTFPLEHESKADYYDSIFHAGAVVGINSSAMIEASIVGRPVLAVLVPEFHDSQLATFHFSYLVDSEGGPVRLAATLDEHLADLGAALGAADPVGLERAQRFVADFVRPHGLERPATEVFVETIEELAHTEVRAEPDASWLRPVGVVVLLAARGGQTLTAAGGAARKRGRPALARGRRAPAALRRRLSVLIGRSPVRRDGAPRSRRQTPEQGGAE